MPVAVRMKSALSALPVKNRTGSTSTKVLAAVFYHSAWYFIQNHQWAEMVRSVSPVRTAVCSGESSRRGVTFCVALKSSSFIYLSGCCRAAADTLLNGRFGPIVQFLAHGFPVVLAGRSEGSSEFLVELRGPTSESHPCFSSRATPLPASYEVLGEPSHLFCRSEKMKSASVGRPESTCRLCPADPHSPTLAALSERRCPRPPAHHPTRPPKACSASGARGQRC